MKTQQEEKKERDIEKKTVTTTTTHKVGSSDIVCFKAERIHAYKVVQSSGYVWGQGHPSPIVACHRRGLFFQPPALASNGGSIATHVLCFWNQT